MVPMLEQISPAFRLILTTSLYATVLIGFILLAKWLLKDRLSVRWHYLFWLLVLVRLVVPWTPESAISLYNFVDLQVEERSASIVAAPQANVTVPTPQLGAPTTVPAPAIVAPDIQQQFEREGTATLSTHHWFMLIWLSGVLVLFITMWSSHRQFIKRNRTAAEITDPRMLQLLEQSKQQLKIRRKIKLVATKEMNSPTLYGVVWPRIFVPMQTLKGFSDREIRAILLHELSHYKRRDIVVNWVMSLALCLHWFNPVVWYAYYRMRCDQEVACDAMALSHMGAQAAQEYAHTIVKLLEKNNRATASPGAANFAGGKSQLKRRIRMITLFKTSSRWSLLGFVLVLLLALVACTGAQNGEERAAGGDRFIDTLNVGEVFQFRGYEWFEELDRIAEREGLDRDEVYEPELQRMLVLEPFTFSDLDFTVDGLEFHFYDEQLVSGGYIAQFEEKEEYVEMANRLAEELSARFDELALRKSLQSFNPETNGSMQWWAEDESRVTLTAFATNAPTYTVTIQVSSPRGTLKGEEITEYGVMLFYPINWEQTEDGDRYRYAGEDGFLQLGAANGASLEAVVEGEVNHPLQPYGSAPEVEELRVGGREAKLILPAADQPEAMERQALVIVEYPSPVMINGTEYEYLLVYANEEYIRQLKRMVRFQ